MHFNTSNNWQSTRIYIQDYKKNIYKIIPKYTKNTYCTYSTIIENNNNLQILNYNTSNSKNIKYISQGSTHYGKVFDDYIILCGNNSYFQLGTNNPNAQTTSINNICIKKLVCGNNRTFIIKKDGNAIGFGSNKYGAIKNNTEPQILLERFKNVEDIATGTHHTVILTKDGNIHFYGKESIKLNELVSGINFNAKKLICGHNYTAILDEHKIYLLGGYICACIDDVDKKLIHKISAIDIVDIECGEDTLFILDKDGKVSYIDRDIKIVPIKIRDKIVKIYACFGYTLFISENGNIYESIILNKMETKIYLKIPSLINILIDYINQDIKKHNVSVLPLDLKRMINSLS